MSNKEKLRDFAKALSLVAENYDNKGCRDLLDSLEELSNKHYELWHSLAVVQNRKQDA